MLDPKNLRMQNLKNKRTAGKLAPAMPPKIEAQSRYYMISPTLGNREFNPKAIERTARFRIPRTEKEGSLERRIQANRAEVLLVPLLPVNRVLYREYSSDLDDHSERISIESKEPRKLEYVEKDFKEVMYDLYLRGAVGDHDHLYAFVDDWEEKVEIETRPNGPSVLPEASANHEIEPGPNGPNVLAKPGRNSTTKAGEIPSDNGRLARAYVEWVEKLPEDELIRFFGHGRWAKCPRRAIDAFKSHDREKGLKLGVNSRADERIRQIIESNVELHARFSSVIARARSLTKD